MALILIQEMRNAKLDIALVHYRAAVTACSLTRQLAGVLPLLEEMNARGVAADVATYNAAISSCTVPKVRGFWLIDRLVGGGVVLIVVHGRSRMTIDPCIPTMPGRSPSGFHRSGRHR